MDLHNGDLYGQRTVALIHFLFTLLEPLGVEIPQLRRRLDMVNGSSNSVGQE